MDKNSLSHTRWECKYHIVFALECQRKMIYEKIRTDIDRVLSERCKKKG
ncbi:transposase, IS200 family [Pseudoramibacter alactolyticus ATCC 23263]|uniref:Transposase, IS200 family n=1 Tax=Pseudoramibacter alactolyticus ATCC 23263 TaxID=887929 RepID=E6MEM5_9FIRM|nr:transposase, IS200 family [Pseudoramibacter alactolyticus ATCC 23263]